MNSITTVTLRPTLFVRAKVVTVRLLQFARKWVLVWLPLLGAFLAFQHFFTIGFNASESLPYHAFLIIKQDRHVERGALIAFRWHGGGPYAAGLTFVKVVCGVPGDVVEMRDRNVFINGNFISTAKTHATTGQRLDPGPTGVIPPHRFYAHAPNPDSLDSRYAITGWIPDDAVLGRAVVIF